VKDKIMHLPNSELEVMMILWEAKGEVSRSYIDEKLQGRQTWGVTTVLNLLARLVDKGFVKVNSTGKGKSNFYEAIISEEEYLESESKSVLGRLCSRSMTSLVANLYKNKSLSESDLDELQAFLDEAKKGR
jgi:predicted transcriptional regulator